jgi:LacI family transcriptional regulator
MAVTIRDIASKLNLSVGAVSRALGGYPDISAATRRRVQETAREMGYVPNRAARQLRKQKSDTLGYIMPVRTPRFADSFFSEFIEGLGDETAEQGYDLLISAAPSGSEKEKTIYQQWVQGKKVDGMVLNRVCAEDWRAAYLCAQNMPFSSLEDPCTCTDPLCIQVDSQSGLEQLVAHIAEQGFRRAAFIGGPDNLRIHIDRLAGFQSALQHHDLPFHSFMVAAGDLTSTGGYHAAQQLLSIPNPPDAIVCINDETAFGALRAALEAGLEIGKEIAIAGFDGVRDANYSSPSLTTLDQPVYDIARQLVRLLVSDLNGSKLADQAPPQRHIIIQPTLLVRASTGGSTAGP